VRNIRRRGFLGAVAGAAGATAVAGVGRPAAARTTGPTRTISVGNVGFDYFTLDGVEQPPLRLRRGETYEFDVDAAGHVFHVATGGRGGDTEAKYTDGVTSSEGDGTVSTGTLTFAVPLDAPDSLRYACGLHRDMGGAIDVGPPVTRAFAVGNVGADYYTVDGAQQPALELTRGRTYRFDVDAAGHPFHLATSGGGGSLDAVYGDGVTVVEGPDDAVGGTPAVETGRLTVTVPLDAPDTLFYECGVHAGMGAALSVVDGPGVVAGRNPPTDRDGDGVYEDVNGDGDASLADVTALFDGREGDAVAADPAAFDVNGNGGFSLSDVTRLFRLRSE
jgi:plastocyanin